MAVAAVATPTALIVRLNCWFVYNYYRARENILPWSAVHWTQYNYFWDEYQVGSNYIDKPEDIFSNTETQNGNITKGNCNKSADITKNTLKR